MRIIGEVPHPAIKITVFHWNNKYLIKLETSLLEQTFKIPEFDISSEADVMKIVSTPFIEKALARFDEMYLTLREAQEGL